MPQIIAVPESSVEHTAQAFVPSGNFLFIERAIAIGTHSFLIAFGHQADIFRTAGTSFDLEYPYTCIHHLIHEMNCLKVFRRHNILVFDIQFDIAVFIFYRISTPTNLHASSPVGGSVHFVQAQVTFTGNGHTESSVGKHFDTDQFSFRSRNLLVDDLPIDFMHLFQIQLTRQDDNIGKTGIEFQCFRIGNVELCGKMHLLSDAVGIVHSCHIGRNDR